MMDDIKDMMKRMEVSTARGRAEINGRAIGLDPDAGEIVRSGRHRADLYIAAARTIGEGIKENRSGILPDELEKAEFIREQLYDLAKAVSLWTIEAEAKA